MIHLCMKGQGREGYNIHPKASNLYKISFDWYIMNFFMISPLGFKIKMMRHQQLQCKYTIWNSNTKKYLNFKNKVKSHEQWKINHSITFPKVYPLFRIKLYEIDLNKTQMINHRILGDLLRPCFLFDISF